MFKGLVTTQDEIEHPVMGKTQHIKTEAIFEKKQPRPAEDADWHQVDGDNNGE